MAVQHYQGAHFRAGIVRATDVSSQYSQLLIPLEDLQDSSPEIGCHEDSIYNSPFYAGCIGYEMCIRAYLNVDGISYKTVPSDQLPWSDGGRVGSFAQMALCIYRVELILMGQEHCQLYCATFKPSLDSSFFKKLYNDINMPLASPSFPSFQC